MQTTQRPAWRSRVGPVAGFSLAGLLGVLMVSGAQGPAAVVMPAVIVATALAVAVWAVWRNRADRAAYEARLTQWAAAEAVLAERIHIAGDLHDIVSHGLGLITVRAAAARLAGDPAEAHDALADIETAGRGATAELRRMLTVLRTQGDVGPRLPVEGLGQLPTIVARAAATGVRARLTVDLVTASQGVEVTVCRTVREALHNVARHVGPSDVRVDVYRDGDTVVAAVSDSGPDGPWPSAPGAGHGLTGLAERVTGLGGVLHAGPVEAGFRLVARIPDHPEPRITRHPKTRIPDQRETRIPDHEETPVPGHPETRVPDHALIRTPGHPKPWIPDHAEKRIPGQAQL